MAELDEIINEPSESEKRIKQLSGKVKEEAEAREAERVARETAEARTQEVERERDFYSSFSDMVSENPAAKDHKEDILAKVKSGYSVEDATYAVLGKAGKLNQSAPEPEVISGGSATTTIPQGGDKSVSEMTQDERRAALLERESEVAQILGPRN